MEGRWSVELFLASPMPVRILYFPALHSQPVSMGSIFTPIEVLFYLPTCAQEVGVHVSHLVLEIRSSEIDRSAAKVQERGHRLVISRVVRSFHHRSQKPYALHLPEYSWSNCQYELAWSLGSSYFELACSLNISPFFFSLSPSSKVVHRKPCL